MSNVKLQIKGVIRFSYLAEGGFAISKFGEAEVRKLLYDPARLLRRFALFKNLTLHSLKLQTHADFKVGLLIGDDFPQDAKDDLVDLLTDLPQAQLIQLPRMVHYRALRISFEQLGDDPDATHTATFRLDDDDAIHKGWLNHIATLAPQLIAVRRKNAPFVMVSNHGFYLDGVDPECPVSEWYEKSPASVGTTLIAPRDDWENVYKRNHRRLGEYHDCYSETMHPMFIRSVHMDNDSHALASGRQGALPKDEIEEHLRQGFGHSFDSLRKISVS